MSPHSSRAPGNIARGIAGRGGIPRQYILLSGAGVDFYLPCLPRWDSRAVLPSFCHAPGFGVGTGLIRVMKFVGFGHRETFVFYFYTNMALILVKKWESVIAAAAARSINAKKEGENIPYSVIWESPSDTYTSPCTKGVNRGVNRRLTLSTLPYASITHAPPPNRFKAELVFSESESSRCSYPGWLVNPHSWVALDLTTRLYAWHNNLTVLGEVETLYACHSVVKTKTKHDRFHIVARVTREWWGSNLC